MQARIWRIPGIALVAAIAVSQAQAYAQGGDPPNPYRSVENWAKLPDGRKWGQTISVDIDRDGKSIWVFERCGGTNCDASDVAPILKIDPSGNVTRSFGAGMFVFPHGLHVDRDGNVWATDGRGKGTKGQQVFKFSPDGKVLMTLGKAGVTGDGSDTFNSPSDVLVAPNGDIFVADGHGGDTNARIAKFSKDGTLIKAWGRKGSGPGEFNVPHRLAMNGIALAQEIGNHYPQIPVLLTSGYSDVVQSAQSQFAILRKPFQLPVLEKSVREALERGAARDGDRVLQFSRWRGSTARE